MFHVMIGIGQSDEHEKKGILIDNDLFSIGTLESDSGDEFAIATSGSSGSRGGAGSKETSPVVAGAKENKSSTAKQTSDGDKGKQDERTTNSGSRNTNLYKHSTQIIDGNQYDALASNADDDDNIDAGIIEIIDETGTLDIDDPSYHKPSERNGIYDEYQTSLNKMLTAQLGAPAPVRFAKTKN